MPGHRKQPKPNCFEKLKDGLRKMTSKRSPAVSPQPSRSTTPAQSERQGLSPGATAVSPPNPEIAPKRVDNGEDALQGGDTDKTDKSNTVQSMPVGPTHGSSLRVDMHVYGGTGGTGGQGGKHGGHGGTGQGPKISFPNSNVNLTDPDATQLQAIKEKLAGHVAAQHKFTDQSKSLCAPGTRVEILADINRWLLPGSVNKERIFWITGIAGSGKSTLSASLVNNLRRNKTPVAAQFFISRNIPETINPGKIIPTIAQQLAEFHPDAARVIHDTLKDGFPSTREEQVQELLLAPIWELSKSSDMVIILIDALDELQNAAKSVLEILSEIAPLDCDLPDNVRFIITSRPEHWADISKSKTLKLTVFKQHTLLTDSSVPEVHNFITVRMKEITPKESGWENWPLSGEMWKLSDKANGLFHYAATALHWIEGQIDEHGRSCQGWVLQNLTQEGGLGQLESLYRVILTSFEDIDKQARNAGRRKVRLASFQHVIGTILVLQEPLTISQIISLLADIPVGNLDVGHFLQQMRSAVIPGTTTSFEEATPQMHKSFRDYIMDGHAPAEFHILTGHAHFVTARSCVEVIVKAGSQSDVVVKYSVQHWYEHLRKAVEGGMTWEDGRMETLFEHMAEKAVVDVWATTDLIDLFVDVAAAGWGLLKQHANKDKMQGSSNILIKAKEVVRRRVREDDVDDDEEVDDVEEEDVDDDVDDDEEVDDVVEEELEELELEEELEEEEDRIPYRKIWDEGLLETWTAVNYSPFQGQG